eukprot:296509-Rhodomonas_salina.2
MPTLLRVPSSSPHAYSATRTSTAPLPPKNQPERPAAAKGFHYSEALAQLPQTKKELRQMVDQHKVVAFTQPTCQRATTQLGPLKAWRVPGGMLGRNGGTPSSGKRSGDRTWWCPSCMR